MATNDLDTDELRERAATWLKGDPTFWCVGRRLLRDLADVLEVRRVDAPEPLRLPAMLIVPEGAVRMGTAAAASSKRMVPIQPGVYEANELRSLMGLPSGPAPPLRIASHGSGARPVLVLDADTRRALPQVLLNMLDPAAAGGTPFRPAWFWVSRARHVAAPLDALAHLVAEATARETQAPVALVTVSAPGAATLEVWDATAKRFAAPVALPARADRQTLAPWLPPGTRPAGRVFVVAPEQPWMLPLAIAPWVRFDGIVYVTDGIPSRIPPALHALLDPTARRFGTFFPTVLVPPKPSRMPWSRADADGRGRFAARELPGASPGATSPAAADSARLFRDACHLTLDLDALRAQWSAWRRQPARSFLDALGPAVRERAERWSRAVTHRRVGVAVSGGGACAFRVTALLEQLAKAGVPVDVLAGLSGGALVGAYYCEEGLPGLKRAAERGGQFQLALPFVLATSWVLQLLVDAHLGSARVGETDVRFAAVTTEMPPRGMPRAAVVEDGSLGEAVRASGTLPPAFGPTRHDGRGYSDGGAATIVPARFARDCGADLTIACSVIPGIRYENPASLPWLAWFATLPPLSRLLDFWTWYAFLWTRISPRFAEEADVHLQFAPQRVPFVESILFAAAGDIADEAQRDENVRAAVARACGKWKALPR